MGSIWIWIAISILFGIIAGYVFTCLAKKTVPDDEDDTTEHATGNLMLNIFLFSAIGFLIVWLLGALLGW